MTLIIMMILEVNRYLSARNATLKCKYLLKKLKSKKSKKDKKMKKGKMVQKGKQSKTPSS